MIGSTDYPAFDKALRDLTGSPPIAVSFTDAAPAGVQRIDRAAASGCTYWKLAQAGQTFFTESADHFGCAVGAYTHGADMGEAQMKDLSGLIETMVGLRYLRQEEVALIPHRTAKLGGVVYAPLAAAPVAPDVVIVRGRPRQLMLLTEAARAAGVAETLPTMGRPACAMIPQSLGTGQASMSVGCIGNRVYTDLSDDEGYVTLPGAALAAVMAQLDAIVSANDALEQFHEQRRAQAEATA